jgi:hypothetical protein
MPILPSSRNAPETGAPANGTSENDRSASSNASVSLPAKQGTVVLEKDVPISQSLIWQRQRDSYVQRGLKSWTEDMVPQFITNNSFIAEIYARIVFGFVCDWLNLSQTDSEPPVPENPLRILELGAGPGKFSFLFLRQLETLLHSRNIPLGVVRYCMTDCSESLVHAWPLNKALSEFFEQGVLQCEVLDAGAEINSRFLRSDTSDSAADTRGPLVVIANYVFDSLPHDAFVIESGRVFELLQTTTARHQIGNNTAPTALSSLQFSYNKVQTTSDRYDDPAWNNILDSYRRRLPGATVLFPSQTLKTLDAIAEFTDGAMLVLAADKGYVHEDSLLISPAAPTYEFHTANCFSQLVNFDAIAKYFESRGGEGFLPEKRSSNLHLCAFLSHQPGAQFNSTRDAIQQAHSSPGPDDLFALLAWLNPQMDEMSVPQILALLKLSRWDPTTFLRLFPVLARQIRNVTIERGDLLEAILRICANHFPITPTDNVLSFQCGVILLELRFFQEASSMLKHSQATLGRSAAASYNLGLCAQGLSRPDEALALMIEACDLDPSFEPACLMRRKLEQHSAK